MTGLWCRIPGAYGCHTQEHADLIRIHLAYIVFQWKQNPECKNLYDPQLVKLMEQASEHLQKKADKETPKKGKEKGDPASTTKKPKKAAKGEASKTTKKGEADDDIDPEEPPKKKAKKVAGDKKKKKKKSSDDDESEDAESSEWTVSEAD